MLPGSICDLNVSFHWFQRRLPASPNVGSGSGPVVGERQL